MYSPSQKIVQSFLWNETIPTDGIQVLSPVEATMAPKIWEKFTCETCNRTLNGEHEWNIHLRSKPHKKRKGKKREPPKDQPN